MRFYQQPHGFYCGIDLHATTRYLCILDQAGQIVFHKLVRGCYLLSLSPCTARSSAQNGMSPGGELA
jgi:hypothetical protein